MYVLARAITEGENELRRFAHVRKVTSVADYVKRINKELNDGRQEANVIPDDQATIAQELFVFALGGEGRHELQRVVASDYSRAQINVKLQSMSSSLVLQHVEDADRMAKAAFAGTSITSATLAPAGSVTQTLNGVATLGALLMGTSVLYGKLSPLLLRDRTAGTA